MLQTAAFGPPFSFVYCHCLSAALDNGEPGRDKNLLLLEPAS
jgi:hypothetical protein